MKIVKLDVFFMWLHKSILVESKSNLSEHFVQLYGTNTVGYSNPKISRLSMTFGQFLMSIFSLFISTIKNCWYLYPWRCQPRQWWWHRKNNNWSPSQDHHHKLLGNQSPMTWHGQSYQFWKIINFDIWLTRKVNNISHIRLLFNISEHFRRTSWKSFMKHISNVNKYTAKMKIWKYSYCLHTWLRKIKLF